ncbi:MAG: CBS domain-containing protein [Candidatus Omnitrophota bacterium]
MQVKDVMTKKLITVGPGMDIHKLAEVFMKENISGAPVIDREGRFLGIVLEEGLIFQDKKVHLPTFINLSIGILTLGAHRFEEEIKRIAGSKVSDIMEKNVITISQETEVVDLATMMIEKGVHYYPVLENGALVGVVTKKDVVRAIAKGLL